MRKFAHGTTENIGTVLASYTKSPRKKERPRLSFFLGGQWGLSFMSMGR